MHDRRNRKIRKDTDRYDDRKKNDEDRKDQWQLPMKLLDRRIHRRREDHRDHNIRKNVAQLPGDQNDQTHDHNTPQRFPAERMFVAFHG